MRKLNLRVGSLAGVVAATGALLLPFSAAAAARPDSSQAPTHPEKFTQTFDAGSACPFELRIDGSGGVRVERTTEVAVISAGTGSALTFANTASGKTLKTTSNGAVVRTTQNPNGTSTFELLGHNVLILAPTDQPAGPSTRLIVGRALFTVDSNDMFVVQSISRNVTDICAALA